MTLASLWLAEVTPAGGFQVFALTMIVIVAASAIYTKLDDILRELRKSKEPK